MLSGISSVSYTRKVFLSAIEKSFYIGLFAPMTHEKTHLISTGNTDTHFNDFDMISSLKRLEWIQDCSE